MLTDSEYFIPRFIAYIFTSIICFLLLGFLLPNLVNKIPTIFAFVFAILIFLFNVIYLIYLWDKQLDVTRTIFYRQEFVFPTLVAFQSLVTFAIVMLITSNDASVIASIGTTRVALVSSSMLLPALTGFLTAYNPKPCPVSCPNPPPINPGTYPPRQITRY
jgi:hypothetical protein